MKQITIEQGQQILAYCLILGLSVTSESNKKYYEAHVRPNQQNGWMGWIDNTWDEDFELIKEFIHNLVGEGVDLDRDPNSPPSTLFINWVIKWI